MIASRFVALALVTLSGAALSVPSVSVPGSEVVVIRSLRVSGSGPGAGPVDEGRVIDLAADATDGSGAALTYTWTFNDGSPPRSGLGLQTLSHRVLDEGGGTLDILLTVQGAAGEVASRQASVTVVNVAPAIGVMDLQSGGGAGTAHSFVAAAADPGVLDELIYAWDFGDGSTGLGATPQHVYSADGTYFVTVTVTDDDGGQDERTRIVVVGEGGGFRATGNVTIPTTDLNFLSVAGAASAGGCQLRMELGIEEEGSVGIQAFLPGGLAPGRYPIGRSSADAGIWTQNLASPGLWTATFGAERKHDPSNRRHFGFWSEQGFIDVTDFDGERIEGTFVISFIERVDPSWQPSQVTVAGSFRRNMAINLLGPSFYLCDVGVEQMQVVDRHPAPNQGGVDGREPELRVTFTHPIDAATAAANVVAEYRVNDGPTAYRAAPGVWVLDPADPNSVVFQPATPLLDAVTYCVRVHSGPNGILSTDGAALRDASPQWDSQMGGACRDSQLWRGESVWSGFSTTPQLDNVRTEVYQVHRGMPLVPGKSTVTRVFWDWAPPDPQLRVHAAAEVNAFLADAWVDTGEGGYLRQNGAIVIRSDRLRAADSINARNSLNFYGWRPAGGVPVEVRATIQPTGQTSPTPRRFTGSSAAPLDRERYPVSLDVDYYFLEVGSWDGGVPGWAIQEGRKLMAQGADFTTQNLPVVETRVRDQGVRDVPDAFFVFRGRQFDASSDLFVASMVPIGWDLLDQVGPTTADVIVGLVPYDVMPNASGAVVHFTTDGGLAPLSTWSAGGSAKRVMLLRLADAASGGTRASPRTVAHETGHYYFLCHSNAPAAPQGCVSGLHDHEGFRVLPGGFRGINKDEGNPEADDGRTRRPLMVAGTGGAALAFISRQHYRPLIRTLQVFGQLQQMGDASPMGGAPAGTVRVASRGFSGITQSPPPLFGPGGVGAWPRDNFGGLTQQSAALELRVTGLVAPDGEVAIGRVNRVEGGPAGPTPEAVSTSPARLSVRLVDAAGQNLAAVDVVTLEASTEHADEGALDAGYRFFSALLPWVEGASRLVVSRDGVVLAERPRSAGPPQVTIAAGSETVGSDGLVELRWTGSDPDGDDLTYAVDYTSDGTSWLPLGSGLTQTSRRIDASLFPPGPAAALRVVVSDGLDEGVAQVALDLPNRLEVLVRLPEGADIDPDQVVSVVFKGHTALPRIDDGALSLFDGAGVVVRGVLVADGDGRRLLFQPLQPLTPGMTYRAVLRAGLEDAMGRRLNDDVAWTFRVGVGGRLRRQGPPTS